MKKLVIALAIIAAVAVHAAEFQWPGWNCKDVALLQEQLALAPDEWKMTISIVLAVAQHQPADFVAACTVIDNAITAIKPEATDAEKLWRKKQYAYFTGQFKADLIAYCQANPSEYDLHVAMQDKTEWGYQTVADCLLKYQYRPKYVIDAVIYLNKQAIALGKDDAEVLDLLKKLNRVFSANLIKDKEVWGGVVAQIRTMMETYK